MKQIIIAGNKHDLEEERKVSKMEINQFCESMGCDYVEVSVLEDKGIDILLEKVIDKAIQVQKLSASTNDDG